MLNDQVNHPSHYTQQPHECQDFRDIMAGPLSDAFKYLWRFEDKKNPEQDIRKAMWYVNRAFQSNITVRRYHREFINTYAKRLMECHFDHMEQAAALSTIIMCFSDEFPFSEDVRVVLIGQLSLLLTNIRSELTNLGNDEHTHIVTATFVQGEAL